MEEEQKNFVMMLKIGTGEKISIEVYPEDTLKILQDRIKDLFGFPLDLDQIKIDGLELDDDTNLYEYFSKNISLVESDQEMDENEMEDEPTSAFEEIDVKPVIDSGWFCAAEGCPSNKFDTPDIYLFKFPLQKRRKLIYRSSRPINISQRLCNPKENISNEQKSGMSHIPCRKCGQYTCQTRRNIITRYKEHFDSFGSIRCQQWLEAARRTDLLGQTIAFINHNLALCALHFTKDQFASKDKRVLKQKAIPTLFNNSQAENKTLYEIIPSASTSTAARDEPGNNILIKLENDSKDYFVSDDEEQFFEEESEPEHPGKLCRLCAEAITADNLFIFSDEGELRSIAEKINSCLPISVLKTDPLPKQICSRCVTRLEINHSFTETCVKADMKLKSMTKKYLVHQLKKQSTEPLSDSVCCPLCSDGRMCTTGCQSENVQSNVICLKSNQSNDNAPAFLLPKGIFPTTAFVPDDTSHDFLTDLYSDEEDTSSNPVYLEEDQVSLRFDCDICEEQLADAVECLAHITLHSTADYHPCLVCGVVLNTKDELRSHFISHDMVTSGRRGKPILECGTCCNKFYTKKNFILHKCSTPILNMVPGDAVEYPCHMCDRIFKSEERAAIHQSAHETGCIYSCETCGMSFETDNILQHHMSYVHEQQTAPTCTACGLRFMSDAQRDRHAHTHSLVTYQCSYCNKHFRDLDVITRHVDSHSNTTLNCARCNILFTHRSAYRRHIETVHESEIKRMPSLIQYQCKICTERFTSSQDVIVHRTTHWLAKDPAKPHICEYCGEAHPSPNALARHRRILHPDEHPYVCTVCEVRTRTLYEARVHRKAHTGYVQQQPKQQSKIYQCEHCPSLFSEKTSFMSHKKSHKVTKGFHCEFCTKVFSERHRLVAHHRQHTGEKPFSCGVCGKKFAQTSAMYTHSLLHTGETPHGCDLCGRRFRIKSDRDNHRRTHTGEKPYSCTYCGKTFRTGQVYYQHRMIHTGERRFPCDICGQAFKRSHTLACHKRIHTGEKPNICDVCGKGFRQRTDMRKHKINIHGVPA